MTKSNIHFRWGIVAFTVFLVALSRLVPHAFGLSGIFNFSPLGGMALFGAAFFFKKIHGIFAASAGFVVQQPVY